MREQLPLAEVTISDGSRTETVVAEVARTSEDQQQGLMCRASVPEGTGMLFIFNEPRPGGFWMFNTYAPLDIIFANETQAIAAIAMEPCPREDGETDEEWPERCSAAAAEYRPDGQYTAALELPQGWLASHDFATGEPETLTIGYELLDNS